MPVIFVSHSFFLHDAFNLIIFCYDLLLCLMTFHSFSTQEVKRKIMIQLKKLLQYSFLVTFKSFSDIDFNIFKISGKRPSKVSIIPKKRPELNILLDSRIELMHFYFFTDLAHNVKNCICHILYFLRSQGLRKQCNKHVY